MTRPARSAAAGPMPLVLRISHTVDAATLTPGSASSPWILRYPHSGFSRASRRTRALMVWQVAGRPVLPRLDLAAWRRRRMSRCQRRIVSGVTSSLNPWRSTLGITLSKAASRARSAQFTCGRRSCRRCRTASWWRRIRISAVFHAASRGDSLSHMVTRVMRRKTNRRHMTCDHRGQGAGRATLLARTVDAILGTHRYKRIQGGLLLDATVDLRRISDVPGIDLPRTCAVLTPRRWRKHRATLSGLIN